MAAEAPNSYRDPYWTDLASGVEAKLDLPRGLLVAIVGRGERSNADQVSEAGARTPFQIIPATRKAAVEQYGIDPYLSPQNAAEVAGLLLRDSLQRNQGDIKTAVAEYHGGTDRANWGRRTQAYVQRVTGQPLPGSMPDGSQSTFDRISAQLSAPTESSIANVYAAYQAGKMTPDEAKAFEADVNAGHVMLPQGAALKAPPVAAGPASIPAPAGVLQAYSDGRMSPAEKAQLEADVRSGAVSLPPGMQLGGGSFRVAIPGAPIAPPAPQHEPGIVDKAIGTGEAALSTATGMTTGTLGMIGGTLKGLAEQILSGQFGTPEAANLVERAASEGAQALTSAPRTQSGQDQAAAVGNAMQQVLPAAAVLPGMLPAGVQSAAPAGVLARAGVEGVARDAANLAARPAEMAGMVAPGAAGEAAAGAAQAATNATANAAAKVASMARDASTLPRRALERLGIADAPAESTPGTMGSVGAAGTDAAAQRRALAADLPVPINLTKGQATRDPAQLKFEVETAKLPEAGAPLRQRAVETNLGILDNMDAWIDQTGAQAPTLRATGMAVDQALVEKAARAKAEVRARYAAAAKSEEASAVVDPSKPVTVGEGENVVSASPIDYLNGKASGLGTTALADAAKQYAVKLGIADIGPDGQLVGKPTTIKSMEAWRREINQATGYEPTDIRDSTILKSLIDQQTEPAAGPLYRMARNARARYAQEFEDRGVIAKLLGNKRGTADRQVALEDIHKHAILDGSLDDVRKVRQLLQTGGEQGKQAWRELQGATLRDIRDKATKSVALDSAGNRVLSPAALDKAINALDADGKLDFIFGKKGAQQLRDIRELAQIARTVPPEAAINMSNTAMTLMSGIGDIAGFSMSGAPVPLFTMGRMALRYVKDRQLQRRISDALNELPKRAPNNKPGTPGIDPQPAIVH